MITFWKESTDQPANWCWLQQDTPWEADSLSAGQKNTRLLIDPEVHALGDKYTELLFKGQLLSSRGYLDIWNLNAISDQHRVNLMLKRIFLLKSRPFGKEKHTFCSTKLHVE
jgi:hypothetical protein